MFFRRCHLIPFALLPFTSIVSVAFLSVALLSGPLHAMQLISIGEDSTSSRLNASQNLYLAKVENPKDCRRLFKDEIKSQKKFLKCVIKVLKRRNLKKAVNGENLGKVIQLQNRILKLEEKLDELIAKGKAEEKIEEILGNRRGNFGGSWSSNLGDTVIAQFDDGTISGSWTDPSSGDIGTLGGKVTGLVLSGGWTFNGNSGSYSLTLKSKNANAFTGYCGAAGPWVGSR